MSDGWIKLHRKIKLNATLRDPFNYFLFVDSLLLEASHTARTIERRDRKIELLPGQLFVSMRVLAKELGVSEAKIRRKLNLFENRRMVRLKTDALGTVVTICNWSEYQNYGEKSDALATHQTTHSRRTRDAPNNKEKKGKKESKQESTDSESYPGTYDQPPLIDIDPEPDSEKLFEVWWQHWAMPGTKRGKGQAKRSYLRIVKKQSATPDQLVDGVKRYMVHCHRNDIPIQFIKHPATWLNGQCWNDELIDEQPDRRNGNGRLSTDDDLAERVAEELDGTEQAFSRVDGNGSGHEPDSSAGPGYSHHGDGQVLPKIPHWFDEDGR